MAVIFSNPVNLHAGANVSPAVQIPDAATAVTITIFKWNGTNSCTLGVDWSFDGGVTWGISEDVGAVTPDILIGKRPNLVITVRTWRICQCGLPYIPGAPYNGIETIHSQFYGYSSAQIAALPSGWLHELYPAAFHNPDNQPKTGLPLRQVRARTVASGNINTTLEVATVP